MPDLASFQFPKKGIEWLIMNINTSHRLSTEAILEYQAIYQEEFGKTLTEDEAEIEAKSVLRFFSIIGQEH